MLKKCAILGLAVLLVGGLALGWLFKETRSEQQRMSRLRSQYANASEDYFAKYGQWHLLSPEEQSRLALEMDKDRQGKSGQQLAQEQQARLSMDIEKLAAGEVSSGEIADFLYGAGWEQEVRKYKKLQEQKEIAHTASVVCISIGGTILSGCTLIWFLYGIVRLARAIRRWRSRPAPGTPTLPQVPELTNIHTEPASEVATVSPPEPRTKSRNVPPTPPSNTPPEPAEHALHEEGFLPRTLGTFGASRRPTLMARKTIEDDPTALLMSDAQSDEQWSAAMQWSTKTVPDTSGDDIIDPPQFSHSSTVSTGRRNTPPPEAPGLLKEHTEDLQKQLAEFKQVAQSVQAATQSRSEPITSTLKELAQQVSAIRDYAASQQDRVEKLQDGYDWGIIRTFCLRVIRCIDNVEKRIEDQGEDDEATSLLEEVRDELLFALESSGVEKFEPEINSDYRGQEKLAEAVKDKQASNKPEHAGRIAKVLRSGYRYIIDDENYKIVRTAQVKLFG